MEKRQFYAARHGQTDWNVEKRFQGHKDEPLNPQGLAQAHSLGEVLKNEQRKNNINFIYSSDLTRAFVTADIVAQYLNAPVVKDERLRERNFGEFEGMLYEELSLILGPDGVENARPEGGEALDEFEARVTGAVWEILEKHPEDTILFVCHGGVIRTKNKYFSKSGVPKGVGFDIENASFYEFEVPDAWDFLTGSEK